MAKVLAVEANMYIFAVAEDGEGIPARLIVEVVPGSGKISLTLNAIVGEDTQRSINNAIRAAVREAGEDFYAYDYYITIESGAEYVGGPSAGLPIALAVYFALKGRDVPDYISATGTIDEYGNVGPVGGIYAKAKAAAEVGVKVFLIPKGERYVEIPSTEEAEPGIVVPGTKKVDIVLYAKKVWGMDIYEVETFKEAVKIAFEGERPEINVDVTEPLPMEENFVPPAVPTKYSQRFEDIVKGLIDDLAEEVEKNCPVDVPGREEALVSAKSYLERARVAFTKGYYYTAGNYAFLGLSLIGAFNLLCEHPSMQDPNSLATREYIAGLSARLEDLTMRAQKYVLTTENYEWVGGARERILRAELSMENLPTEPIILLRELKSVEYWLISAEEMLNVADELNGGVEVSGLDEMARNEIIFVEDLLYASGRDSEVARMRLEIAKRAYERGWYFAAYAEAALAKGVFIGENADEELLRDRVNELLEKTQDYVGLWAELYRNHGIYYKEAADYYRVKGDELRYVEMLRTSLQMLEAAYEFSTLASSLNVPSVTVVVKGNNVPYQYLALAVALLLILLLGLLATRERGVPRHPHLREIPPERREEARRLIQRLELLAKVRKRLEGLLKHDVDGVVASEIKRIEREMEKTIKRLERLAAREPPRRSSRPSRGRRR
ncbi:MAG: hypothetical protein GXO00_00345 [Candidatus Diapherotrites archaeon]|nr:hypothetical protein [Candidatus Diapherotrites archaeon]